MSSGRFIDSLPLPVATICALSPGEFFDLAAEGAISFVDAYHVKACKVLAISARLQGGYSKKCPRV